MAEGTQQHPLRTYFYVWTLLFVLSAFSYMVDWFQFQGFLRWGLILLFYDAQSRIYLCYIYAYVLGKGAYYISNFTPLFCYFSFCIHYVE